MALAPVTLHESLRPWRAAGLLHILLAMPVRDDEAGSALSAAVPAGREGISAVSSAPGRRAAASGPAARPVPAEGETADARGVDAGSAAPLRIAARPLPLAQPQDWAEPWQSAFSKARRAPLVWSYHELGLDLAGMGSAERGRFFRELIAGLGLPGGTVTFWPTAVLARDDAGAEPVLRPDASVYHTGLKLLAARAVVLFGRQSLHDAEYGALPLFAQRLDAGRLILHAPGLDQLLADPGQVRVTLSFLQAALGFLV